MAKTKKIQEPEITEEKVIVEESKSLNEVIEHNEKEEDIITEEKAKKAKKEEVEKEIEEIEVVKEEPKKEDQSPEQHPFAIFAR